MTGERVDRSPAAAVPSFGSRLAALVAVRESQLVLGLDPDPSRLWPEAHAAADRAADHSPAARAAHAVAAHCRAAIAAAGNACVAVKPQVACFERLGAPGWRALAQVAEAVHEAGLLLIADAKRGDIDVTATAYGQAFFGGTDTPFGRVGGLQADALTASPYLGGDSIGALLDVARQTAGGLFVLVRTSNPGAADFQDGPLAERVARTVARLGEHEDEPDDARAGQPDDARAGRSSEAGRRAAGHLAGEAGRRAAGLRAPADVGAVVGATAPDQLTRMRELMPHAPFLLPGVGAQGGRVEDLAAAFAPGPAHGLVSASRSIVNAHEQRGDPPADAARREAERLREIAWTLDAGGG